jgi:VCBS repeat-containing protein
VTPSSALSLFSPSNTPPVANDPNAVEVGVKFTSATSGQITGIRFYKGSGNTGTHVGNLWSGSGILRATAAFTNETASGWQQVNFSTPVSITAGTTYIASYHTNTGHYADTPYYFATYQGQSNGSLIAAGNSLNGVYAYGASSTFPNNTSTSADNYWADVVFASSVANTPPTAVADTANATEKGGIANGSGGSPASGNVLANDTDPDPGDTKTVTAVSFGTVTGTLGTPLAGAHGSLVLNAAGAFTYTVNENDAAVQALRLSTNTLTDAFSYTMRDTAGATSSTTLTVTIHGANDAPVLAAQTASQNAIVGSPFSLTLPAGTFTDVDAGDNTLSYTATAADGSALPSWLTFNASTRTFSGTPAAANVGTLSVKASAADLGGLAASETFNIAVTTTAPPPTTVSLFTASNTPAQTNLNDGTPLEVGVKFTSSVAGQITALKFYRSPGDNGSDLLDLWTSGGTRLGGATFTNTAASGWQTVNLTTPVTIAANTTYVASYHTTGEYVTTDNFFTTAVTNGTLTAPSTTTAGGNGVYAYGGTSTTGIFPTNTFGAANYWADVVFARNLAPAGVAGEAINLGLTNPPDHLGPIRVDISGVPSGWTVSEGSGNGDGTWSVQTYDVSALSITAPSNYAGAVSLQMSQTWTDSTGGTGLAMINNNVEAYASGAPIFAISGDDNLSGSGENDVFVLAQPIGNDTIHGFDFAHDKVDLIGFSGLSSFFDVQTSLSENSNGDAVITIAEGGSITFDGVSAASLTADDFVFNLDTVMNNANSIVIGDNAVLPLAGTVNNSGTIELASIGGQTRLQVLANGLTLEGGGHVEFSDGNGNIVVGTTPDATLTNVDNTISGSGQLGEGQLTLHNKGTIIASGSNALTIDTGANVVINSGTLGATGSGGLAIHSDIADSGLLWANGGSITIDGNVSGTGSALINGVATFEMGGVFGENITLGAGARATLKIDHAADFSGTVAGLDGDDVLDLADLAFGSNTTLGYAANSNNTGGTLTASDGTHTANIELLGQYMASSFVMSADGVGGTLIHDLPPATLTDTLTQPQHA